MYRLITYVEKYKEIILGVEIKLLQSYLFYNHGYIFVSKYSVFKFKLRMYELSIYFRKH